MHEHDPFNAEPPRGVLVRSELTEQTAFYVRNHGPVPDVDPDVSHIAAPPQRFGASIPAAKALAEEVLLAWEMNGEPLLAVHGAPVRVVVPGYIGARSVKWVDTITAQDHPSDNYFQATAYRLLPPEADASTAGHGDGLSLGPIALNWLLPRLTSLPGSRGRGR